ncbi:hypothetical protein Pan258_38980 [Symmachiella dynata]|uniref:DUF4153 domain-containing protein n=1 Tax=Symmachiella dynata TaxID=2527995 RepID=UPI00118D53B9|nr:DUF4153 domain-containing protein [Symmachiella dynata]QDT49843.1 hypothetical protein Pan258_38980 [Symmachiella dynata]
MNGPQEPAQPDDALVIETFYDESDATPLDPASGRKQSPQPPREPPSPLRWAELIGVFLLIVLCDLTIYHGHGFAGYAALFFVAPILLWVSSNRRRGGPAFWIVSFMVLALAAKMLWCGSNALVAVGFTLIVAFAMTLVGRCPYVLEMLFFALQTAQAGFYGIIRFGRQINRLGPIIPRAGWVSIVLPLLAFLVFGWIFVLANPDLNVWFGQGMTQLFNSVQAWVEHYSPDPLEIGFWGAVLWIVLGLLRPVMVDSQVFSTTSEIPADETPATIEAYLYPALLNTLVTVVVLFGAYLVFEFKSMWFHEFPPGFHYSGYAHEGAAWLTAALALATIMLSLVFRGDILRERRVGTLRRLAWLWSIENMLLAASVYNRLFIYIGFNGMSRMRIVGLFGMTAVVVGFLLVIWKIARNRNLLWLARRHLWTLAIALYLLALTPLDTLVVGYNVRRILDGDPAPSVQISVHPINAEGILQLQPLLDSDNEIIREGVRALLAVHHSEAESTATHRWALGWTTYQIADEIALKEFRQNQEAWQQYADPKVRQAALDRFHKYAYQWF